MRIFVLDSGVDIWKVTPSKSETTWSIDTGVGLQRQLAGASGGYTNVGSGRTRRTAPLGGTE